MRVTGVRVWGDRSEVMRVIGMRVRETGTKVWE